MLQRKYIGISEANGAAVTILYSYRTGNLGNKQTQPYSKYTMNNLI